MNDNKPLKTDVNTKEHLVRDIKNDDDVSSDEKDFLISNLNKYHNIEILSNGVVVGKLGASKSILNDEFKEISPRYHRIESSGNCYKVKLGASSGTICKNDLNREWFKISRKVKDVTSFSKKPLVFDVDLREKIKNISCVDDSTIDYIIDEYNKYVSQNRQYHKSSGWFSYCEARSNITMMVRFPHRKVDLNHLNGRNRDVNNTDNTDEKDNLVDRFIMWIGGK